MCFCFRSRCGLPGGSAVVCGEVGLVVWCCVVFCFFCLCWKNQFFHNMKFTKIMQRHKKGYLHGLWVPHWEIRRILMDFLWFWIVVCSLEIFGFWGCQVLRQYFLWVDRPHGLNKIWGVRIFCWSFPGNLWCWASWAVKLVEGTNWKSWHATPHLHP